jgi:hypothetical protein
MLPRALLDLLEAWGVDPNKACLVVEIGPNSDGSHFYEGWYHVVGTIVGRPVAGDSVELDGVEISFEESDFVPAEFPRPVVQLHFYCDVPWVLLDEPF